MIVIVIGILFECFFFVKLFINDLLLVLAFGKGARIVPDHSSIGSFDFLLQVILKLALEFS